VLCAVRLLAGQCILHIIAVSLTYTFSAAARRSERQKNALLRKLDLLTQDASSEDYHKGIVNLAGE
jgi:hypothetical protein